MFETFYGLKANPFTVNPDPRYLYLTRDTREALSCLAYGVRNRKGFTLLTGGVGTGKTTVLNKFMEWLMAEKVTTAFIFNPRLNFSEFLDYMMADFGIPSEGREKGKLLFHLNRWLLDRYEAGQTAVLIIDEAQNLSTEALEEIRLLTNLETSTDKLLQIVLCGQPELEVKLKLPLLHQLWQRITLRCHTRPFTAEELTEYIKQRLTIAGSNGQPIFRADALDVIYRYSRGIPRVTNLLCEHALISGFVDQERSISAATIRAVAQDLELQEAGLSTAEGDAVPGPWRESCHRDFLGNAANEESYEQNP
ncbi:AAA family ATPase [Acidobacteria bacterium AB60]|nr:AAA family ATPase [Acidobacteria bacterium AB60]